MERNRFGRNIKLKNITDSISLKGKTSLISGASSGIGRSISYRFAEAGSDLILVDINEDGLKDTLECVKEFDCIKKIYKIDLSKKEEIDRYWFDPDFIVPDIIINNAGIYPFKDYLKVDEVFYAKTLEVNLHSVFWMCQNFIRRRAKKGGVIVNIASIEGVIPFKEDMAHYSISKSGVIALTRSLARDYGKKGFRVNGILPGAIKTPGTEILIKTAIAKLQFNLIKTSRDFSSRLTIGRWGNSDEVAKVVLFLSSDMASYVHGAIIPVDGGFLSA
ncbi:MAG: SDR family NAD(P)-dependent oxidoreductase [Actinomycetota bacterium]|nr:SDR family NAD(P)-dependent oxidoreductase [Actinomycetota bacterium]